MLNVQFIQDNDDVLIVEMQAVYDANTFITITLDS